MWYVKAEIPQWRLYVLVSLQRKKPIKFVDDIYHYSCPSEQHYKMLRHFVQGQMFPMTS